MAWNNLVQQFTVIKNTSTYRISREFFRENGPDYLIISIPSPESLEWIVDFQTGEEDSVIGFESLALAVGGCVQHFMEFEEVE